MTKLRTHYDNLQVSRSASLEVIKAAYRTLSAKYHPDRNLGDPRCAEIMSLLNTSYAVLSDQHARRKHDDWIRRQEAARTVRPSRHAFDQGAHSDFRGHSETPVWTSNTSPSNGRYWPSSRSTSGATEAALDEGRLGKFAALLASAAAACLLVFGLISEQQAGTRAAAGEPRRANTQASVRTPRPSEEAPVNVPVVPAPNGRAWPRSAGYVQGYPRLETQGHSDVTIDNSSNAFGVFLKLNKLDGRERRAVRHIHIPAFGAFRMQSLPPGRYDIRYINLNDGGVTGSEPFELTQVKDADGLRFNNVTMTLFEVADGSMVTYPIEASDF